MIPLHIFPALNASLNASAALLMTVGYVGIRTKRVALHRACMIAAVAVSTVFLICYVTYHIRKGEPTRFGGIGAIRTVYFTMLISHIVLAVAIVPLVLRTVYLGIKGRREQHRRWARWTFPLWYYVSVTGVLVYYFLYHGWPAQAPA